jgi:hypothetical protein
MTHQCTTRCAVHENGVVVESERKRSELERRRCPRGVGRVHFEVRHLVEILNSGRRFFHGAMYSWICVGQLEDLEGA